MRRTHLRGRENIEKRYLVHVAAYNLGILMRALLGKGTPRGFQGRIAAFCAAWSGVMDLMKAKLTHLVSFWDPITRDLVTRSAA